MNLVAENLQLESLLLEHDVFYNGELISTNMKKSFFQRHSIC